MRGKRDKRGPKLATEIKNTSRIPAWALKVKHAFPEKKRPVIRPGVKLHGAWL
jgi:hypothetical protein